MEALVKLAGSLGVELSELGEALKGLNYDELRQLAEMANRRAETRLTEVREGKRDLKDL
jgi:hypothetical protein